MATLNVVKEVIKKENLVKKIEYSLHCAVCFMLKRSDILQTNFLYYKCVTADICCRREEVPPFLILPVLSSMETLIFNMVFKI